MIILLFSLRYLSHLSPGLFTEDSIYFARWNCVLFSEDCLLPDRFSECLTALKSELAFLSLLFNIIKSAQSPAARSVLASSLSAEFSSVHAQCPRSEVQLYDILIFLHLHKKEMKSTYSNYTRKKYTCMIRVCVTKC